MSHERGFWSLPTEKGYKNHSLMVKIAVPSVSCVFAMIMLAFAPHPSVIAFFAWWIVMAGFVLATFVAIFGIVRLLSTVDTAMKSVDESVMKKKNCPFCDEKISQRAAICPHCRMQLLPIEK